VAIRFDDAAEHTVNIGTRQVKLLVAGNVDKLIDDYIEAQTQGTVPADRSPFGAVLWPSGRALVREFEHGFASAGVHPPHEVFELGCGVGLVGGYFAARGAHTVLATDYEPALAPFVRANARRLCQALAPEDEVLTRERALRFETLDWTMPCPEPWRGRWKFVVATDVLYENVHVEFLPKIASALLHPDGEFHLADPERYRFTAALENLHRHFGHVEQRTVELAVDDDDASRGVVNTSVRLSKVHLLRCTEPRPEAV